MEPNIWGPGAWIFLHSIALNYPKNPLIEDKKIYLDFFNILYKILPCDACKTNFKKHLNDRPINFYLKSKDTLNRWLVDIHNQTNIQNGKPPINYKDFLNTYKSLYNDNQETNINLHPKMQNKTRLIHTLSIVILILSILLIYCFAKNL